MTKGELEDAKIIFVAGQKLFMMKELRAVICPEASLVFSEHKNIVSCFTDLQTWALPISELMQNQ